MDNYYTIKITGGTSTGPYTIYYDVIGSGNIAQIYPSSLPATGITLASLTSVSGVQVAVPNTTTGITLYNESCMTYENFDVEPTPPTLTCLCITLLDTKNNVTTLIDICDSGTLVNGKPYYTGNTANVSWNTNGYWEMLGYLPYGGYFRSGDFDNIPDSNWYSYNPLGMEYYIIAQIGTCASIPESSKTVLTLNSTPSDCYQNNGTIGANVILGVAPYSFSLDGVNFNNPIGWFTGLAPNTYTVYYKDANNYVISQNVTVGGTNVNTYTLAATATNFTYDGTSGNYKYYSFQYDLSNPFSLPLGINVTAEFMLEYSVIGSGPGSVAWDVNNHSFVINGSPQTINTVVPFSLGNGASDTCNPIYINKTGNAIYKSGPFTFNNGDTLAGTIQIGINTETSGQSVLPCITKGDANVTVYLNIISNSCNCCQIISDRVVRNQIQIYTP